MTIAGRKRTPQPVIEDKTINIEVGSARGRTLVNDVVDPFAIKGEDLKRVRGTDGVTKRRHNRLEKAFTGHGDAGSKRDEVEAEVDAYNLFSVVLPRFNQDYLARIYEMSAPHAAAVDAKVSNIAGLGYDFIESHAVRRKLGEATDPAKKAKLQKKLNNMKEELYDWLDGCNAEDDFGETLIKVWTDYEVTGNGYFEIGRTFDGTIGYIGHIPASTMRVRKERDGFVQMVSNRVKFFRNFGDTFTTDRIGNDPMPNEIIHLKNYSPTGQYYGVPDVISAQQAIVGNEFASRFNMEYFENKAVPRYVVVIKGGSLGENSTQNLLEFFETGLKGQSHRTLVVPMPADDADRKTSFDMKPVEAGQQDSSFGNYRKGNLSDVLMAHRVPINKVSVSEGISLAASRDADKTFKEQVCRPAQKILEKKLNKIFNEVSGGVFRMKLNELSLTDEDTQSKIDERYLRFGVVTPNEIRARSGQEGLPNGDKTYLEVMAEQAEAAAKVKSDQAEEKAQMTGNRVRDQQRSSNGTDSNGEGRNEQGAGRAQG